MNCEHVEERLSAYLDNVLTSAERREMAIHLQACPMCMMSLAELHQNDILLAQLPRVSPRIALHERIFSSPEFLELTGTTNSQFLLADEWTIPLKPRRSAGERPLLVALPGGRNSQSQPAEIELTPPTIKLHPMTEIGAPRRRKKIPFSPLQIAMTAILIIALVTLGLLRLSTRQSSTTANTAGAITPPASGPGLTGPLAAGTRFVFLRDGALWSTLVDGSSRQPEQLTPPNVHVADNWVVCPTLAGHTAGNLLTYIDLQSAQLHTVRSDGQQDTVIQQPLLKAGSAPGTIWETPAGGTILNSLAWSRDGSWLAFVGDPDGDGQTGLYLYSTETGKVQPVILSIRGSVSHPVWSPDDTRLAFEIAHDGLVSILDYNVQNQGVLDLTNLVAAQGNDVNSILALGWSLDTTTPAVTWSLGSTGHVNALWIHRVGAGGTVYPQQLLNGVYAQALYSPNGDNGVGSWLLVSIANGLNGDISRLDLTPGATRVPLSQGRRVSFARWSPDGASLFYLDAQGNGPGKGYLVNAASGVNLMLTSSVAASPAPAWSADSQQLVYSTGTAINIANVQNGAQVLQLSLQGTPTSLVWSPANLHQLVVALGDTTQGIYLVDTIHNSAQRLDQAGTSSQIQWTQIP